MHEVNSDPSSVGADMPDADQQAASGGIHPASGLFASSIAAKDQIQPKTEEILDSSSEMSHDFNNLLMTIGGYAELLTERLPKTSLEQSYAEQILESVQQAERMVRELPVLLKLPALASA